MADHVAEWQVLDNKSYCRRDIYHYEPSREARENVLTLGDIQFERCRMFPARFGGPIAIIRDDEITQKADVHSTRICRIFTQAGYILGEFYVFNILKSLL